MSEKLSIVIPAYNEEKNIAKCINELQATLREKYEIPYEIIVVNDNSSDDTERRSGPRWSRCRNPARQPDAAGRVRPRDPVGPGGRQRRRRRRLHGRSLGLARGRRRILPQNP